MISPAVVALFALLAAGDCAVPLMPDAATGQIDGHAAFLFWPSKTSSPDSLLVDRQNLEFPSR